MRLSTVAQSREIDELAQKVYGVSAEALMESAGALAAREIEQAYFPELSKGSIAVVCGPGNNGGDGLVVARHLHSVGYRDLVIYTMAPKNQQSELFKLQAKRAELFGIRLFSLLDHPEKTEQIRSSTLIVDALFGIGLSRDLKDPFLSLVEMINSCKTSVISLDCPTGLDCDRGIVSGHVVRAHSTLSFGLAKPGFFVSQGPQYVGRLRILPIGFPFEALRGVATNHFLFNEKLALRYLPQRKATGNKANHGKALVVAGREGYWGAGVLSVLGAYRMGAGYVTWASHSSPEPQIAEAPEALTATVNEVMGRLEEFDAVGLGPGLGVNEKTAEFITRLKEYKDIPVVMDADGITTCIQFDLFPLPSHWVITPHAGELSRALKCEVKNIEMNRFKMARSAVDEIGCHVLLKGFRSVLAHQDRVMVVHSGNAALATAGTGDVLTGMITSLLAQGVEPVPAASTAAYIHGRLADEWVRKGQDGRSFTASDLKDLLPDLLGRIRGGTFL